MAYLTGYLTELTVPDAALPSPRPFPPVPFAFAFWTVGATCSLPLPARA